MKTFEKNLSRAVEQMVPEDGFDRIMQALPSATERRTEMKTKVTQLETAKKGNKQVLRWISGIAAAVLLLASGAFGGFYYASNVAVDSVVSIDVNPSITITTNRQEKVLSVKAENEDAAAIIEGLSLENVDLEAAVDALVEALTASGYLTEADDNTILVSVRHKDEKRAKHIRNEVLTDIQKSLKEKKVKASVLNQTVTEEAEPTETETFAKENAISRGKANFVLKLAEKDATLNAEELAQMTLKEITALVVEKDIALHEIVNYDEDDSAFENIKDHIEDKNEELTTQAAVTLQQAKEAALADAGLTAEDVVFIKAKLDYDDGVLCYEIEFYANGIEYEYEIDAMAGSVLNVEKEEDEHHGKKTEQKPASKPESKPTVSKTTLSTEGYITADAAKAAALADAGLTAEDVAFIKAKLDRDDGKVYYDVEFKANGVEYEYEIDAVSGAVLSKETDTDDDDDDDKKPVTVTKPSVSKTTVSAENYITADEAKAAALADAKLTAEQVTDITAELDREGGKVYYEVEFCVDGAEYEYKVDAVSGKVLVSDKDAHHKHDNECKPDRETEKTSKATKDTKATSTTATTVTTATDATSATVAVTATKPTAVTKPTVVTKTTAATKPSISPDKAKEEALEHAGLKEPDVTIVHQDHDRDDEGDHYDIEFHTDEHKYEYEIDANTGAVREHSKETRK